MAEPDRILLLDVDGVLVMPPEYYGVKIRRDAPEAADSFFATTFPAATRGELNLADHLGPLLAALGRSCSADEFLAEWHDYENIIHQPLWDAVTQVRGRFQSVHLATNQEQHRVRHLMGKTGLERLVDGQFASCHVGHRKPDLAYYAEVTRRLGCQPGQIVFFDDAEENVAAAREFGWKGHLYTGVDSFWAALEARG